MKDEVREEGAALDLEKWIAAFRRRRKTFWTVFTLSALVSLAAIVLIPASYLSKSTILIEQQEIPQDLVRSTVTSYADQRIEVIAQRVMTSVNLWKIIEKYNLYQEELKRETRESVISQMREKDINRNVISADVVDPRSGRPTEATIAFQLSFEYESPTMAQKVANELTSLFLSENLKTRTNMAEQASIFLEAEASKLRLEVQDLENRLAEFKQANFESLPELTDLNIKLLDRTEQSIQENRSQINYAKERISFLESQLSQIDPNIPVQSRKGERLLSSKVRLKFAKQELEQAEARYSNDHPDVIQLKSEIRNLLDQVDDTDAPALKREVYERELETLQQRYNDEHPSISALKVRISNLKNLELEVGQALKDPTADNPAYLQVRGQLESAQIELQGLLAKMEVLTADLTKYEQRITDAPRIEQEYQNLSRDYQTTALKYAEVKAKQQEAALGKSLESEQKGERFTLIEPPLVPEEAHSPNRKVLCLLGIIVTLGLSVGLVVLKEMLDQSIKGRRDLVAALGSPPLAVIPAISTQNELASKRQARLFMLLGGVLTFATLLVVFHIFVKPLDVTWFVAMRKFGLM